MQSHHFRYAMPCFAHRTTSLLYSQLPHSPYETVTQRTAIRPPPPLPNVKGELESDPESAELPLPLLPLSSELPVGAASCPKLPKACPVTPDDVSLLFCPVGCIRSSGMLIFKLINLATMIGPKNKRMKTTSKKKYKVAYLMTRLFRSRDCLIE